MDIDRLIKQNSERTSEMVGVSVTIIYSEDRDPEVSFFTDEDGIIFSAPKSRFDEEFQAWFKREWPGEPPF